MVCFFKAAFNLSAINIGARQIFIVGCCSVCCRMFSCIPGLYPPDIISTLPSAVTTKNVSRYCQISPGKKSPLVGNHCSKGQVSTGLLTNAGVLFGKI